MQPKIGGWRKLNFKDVTMIHINVQMIPIAEEVISPGSKSFGLCCHWEASGFYKHILLKLSVYDLLRV